MDLLTPELGLFFWTLIAFLAVFFILRKAAWKPILNTLGEREKGIADSIAAAERIKAEMGQLQAENEKLMADAREESAKLMQEARETRDRIVNEAKDAAKVEANKILVDSQKQIQQQKMAAMAEVKNEISRLSINVAEKILRTKLDSADAQNNYVSQLTEEIKLN